MPDRRVIFDSRPGVVAVVDSSSSSPQALKKASPTTSNPIQAAVRPLRPQRCTSTTPLLDGGEKLARASERALGVVTRAWVGA